jgi:ATP-dependent Clp protease, protease subunit
LTRFARGPFLIAFQTLIIFPVAANRDVFQAAKRAARSRQAVQSVGFAPCNVHSMPVPSDDAPEGPPEIAICGDLAEHEADVTEKLLAVPLGGECVLYFNSPGGSAYAALSLASLVALRGLAATGVVLGECSSAAIWPLAACRRRIVTAHSVLLFHPLKWESGEHVDISEAAEWARHFAHLEQDMDLVLARLLGVEPEKLAAWMRPGKYVTGREFAEAGLAELVELAPRSDLVPRPTPASKKKSKR